ncbi:hypothetical protein AB3X52_09940 [Nocardioides sp. DS6]|uniref:Type VII secretion integral membrane protein EccD n=1 Tax=Nocardioides eburneus TaxID=3231482 RepID=A0ABV3SZQ4_9ACTN
MTRQSAMVGGALAVTVHGPDGVLDLVVPADAEASDVAREYAAQLGLSAVPTLRDCRGERFSPSEELSVRGVTSGDVLVVESGAAAPRRTPRRRPADPQSQGPAEALSALWVALAAGVAGLAGWAGAHSSGARHDTAVVLLGIAALIGLVPSGALGPRRAVAAPVFAGAAAFVVAWSPDPERAPTVIGVSALVAGVVAALARAVDRRAEEALRVWVVAGVAVFVVTCACALLGAAPEVPWGLLLVGSVLAARLVPSYAVDVPDATLIDLERLAVTAWSARARPAGRRGRTIVPVALVAEVAARGARTLTAAAWAVLALAGLSAPMLLATATDPVDRVGARIVVIAGACALLLAARSHRHAAPRALLRTAGVLTGAVGLAQVIAHAGDGVVVTLGIVAVVIGVLVVVAAVATGRGWRSVWWAARADLVEGLAGAVTIGTLVVAVGLFRHLWESGFGV